MAFTVWIKNKLTKPQRAELLRDLLSLVDQKAEVLDDIADELSDAGYDYDSVPDEEEEEEDDFDYGDGLGVSLAATALPTEESK